MVEGQAFERCGEVADLDRPAADTSIFALDGLLVG